MSRLGVDTASVSTLSAVAANEPTKFNAAERSAFLRAHIQQIRRMVQDRHTVDDIKSCFPEFTEQYPSLLEMLTRPSGYDERSLSMMINMLDKMGSNTKTQHEASIQVGQHLINTFVKPQMDGTL
jgi:hypothetical protein